MAHYENLPFPIGKTFFDGQTIATADVTASKSLEGREYWIEDLDYSASVPTRRSGLLKRVRVVRNNSGIALLPKRLAILENTAGVYGGRVDGMCRLGYGSTTLPAVAFPIDEFLPTAGVPNNDLFYITVEGPAVVLTALANMGADVAVGDWLVHATAATSQATTAGRFTTNALTAADTGLTAYREDDRRIGRAMSAMTSQGTNQSVLINISRW